MSALAAKYEGHREKSENKTTKGGCIVGLSCSPAAEMLAAIALLGAVAVLAAAYRRRLSSAEADVTSATAAATPAAAVALAL